MHILKKPDLTDPALRAKLAKGMGHNYYGEPAWPNDLLYIFPVVILGTIACVVAWQSWILPCLEIKLIPLPPLGNSSRVVSLPCFSDSQGCTKQASRYCPSDHGSPWLDADSLHRKLQ
jgi:hypothetical protein